MVPRDSSVEGYHSGSDGDNNSQALPKCEGVANLSKPSPGRPLQWRQWWQEVRHPRLT